MIPFILSFFHTMSIWFFVFGGILLVMIVVSLWFAFSGWVDRYTTPGWVFLAVFSAVYISFCKVWFGSLVDSPSGIMVSLMSVVLSGLILATQGPLLIELISRSVLPDPFRSMKILKVHSQAERKVVEDDLPGAIEEYEKIIAGDPGDIEARFRMADLCYQNKDYRKAVEAYQALLELSEKLDLSQQCSALMRLSEIHAGNLGDIEGARKYLEKIIEEHPETKFSEYATERLIVLSGRSLTAG
jgi:hypothetical protein